MYAVNTILKLKKQRGPDSETKEKFPYNRVRVIGQSPISHSHKGDYEGADAVGVILTPLTNFGSTLDEPFGKCKQLYDVESIPEVEVAVSQPVRVIDATSAAAGPTPEEVFAKEAPGKPKDEKRAERSPLEDPGDPKKKSVLDG